MAGLGKTLNELFEVFPTAKALIAELAIIAAAIIIVIIFFDINLTSYDLSLCDLFTVIIVA
mgnify:FL=1